MVSFNFQANIARSSCLKGAEWENKCVDYNKKRNQGGVRALRFAFYMEMWRINCLICEPGYHYTNLR